MPMAPPKFCQGPGPHTNGGTAESGELCNACRAKSKDRKREGDRFRAKNDKVRQFELSTAWINYSQAVRSNNPLCQVVENGRQCQHVSELTHHIVDPKDAWDLRLDWSNLVAICFKHHSHARGDIVPRQYVPTRRTILGNVEVFEHAAPVVQPTASTIGQPPESVPVAPEHANLPDGTEAIKREYLRTYRKQGARWLLIPA